MPTASVRIQEALGIEQCREISIHANCTSAYKALLVASDFIKSGRYKKALVISSSMSSSELRAEYYNQAIVKKDWSVKKLINPFLVISKNSNSMTIKYSTDH